VTLNENGGRKLFVIFGQGETARVFDFDGVKGPEPGQSLTATNELFTCAADVAGGLVVFSQPTSGKFSTRYRWFSKLTVRPTLRDLSAVWPLWLTTIISLSRTSLRGPCPTYRDQPERDEALHKRDPRHAGKLRHGAHSGGEFVMEQPGQRAGAQA